MRWLEWKGAAQVIRQNLFVGNGLGTFSIFFPSVQPAEFAKIAVERNEFLRHAHNEYLEIWGELGILGIIVFASILLATIISGFRLLKSSKNNRSFFLVLCIK